jgi:hypothetical protein
MSGGELRATFSFTGTSDGGDTKIITDGSFRLKYNN